MLRAMEKNISTFYNEVVNQLEEIKRQTIKLATLEERLRRYMDDAETSGMLNKRTQFI